MKEVKKKREKREEKRERKKERGKKNREKKEKDKKRGKKRGKKRKKKDVGRLYLEVISFYIVGRTKVRDRTSAKRTLYQSAICHLSSSQPLHV